MTVLFVHGLYWSPLTWRLLRFLRRAGFQTRGFYYLAPFESFDSIISRLRLRIRQVALSGEYVVVGHSLGGVMLREAINGLPAETTRPQHAFFLGSPMRSSRVAIWLRNNLLFRVLGGDCGQLLGTAERMADIGPIDVPTTSIVGTRGIYLQFGPYGIDPNDGLVTVSEASAGWVSRQVELPLTHTMLTGSYRVAKIIVETLNQLTEDQQNVVSPANS